MLRSIPKTVYFNFKYLKFNQAVKLPLWISHRVTLSCLKGEVILSKCSTGLIQIGFDRTGLFDEGLKSAWDVSGLIRFNGKTRIGPAAKISVSGELILGENFLAGSGMSIFCANNVSFGKDCLLSWDVTLMDNDFHEIRDGSGKLINQAKPIRFGQDIWIGCKATILKGGGSDDGCVVAAGTLLNKRLDVRHCIIGGLPVRVLKEDILWRP